MSNLEHINLREMRFSPGGALGNSALPKTRGLRRVVPALLHKKMKKVPFGGYPFVPKCRLMEGWCSRVLVHTGVS